MYEVAALTAHAQGGPALLFENVEESSYRIVTNLVGTRGRFAQALGTSVDSIHQRMQHAVSDSSEPQNTIQSDFMQNCRGDIGDMPIVKHFEKESGAFITSSVVFARNPQSGLQNASFHRMMPLDSRLFTIRMVEGRHLHRCFVDAAEHGEDLQVAVVVGVHPAVLIAGAYQAAWGESEMSIANAILNYKLSISKLPWSGLLVPAHSEIVIEGKILHDATHKEWMVEMLQTYDHAREQPIFQTERVYHRDNPIFHDTLAGYGEHRLLMGMPAESKMHVALSNIPQVRGAALSQGGCNWMHAVISINKDENTDTSHIIHRAFEAHRSLKQVTLVDEDIDPHDATSVEYAMATRFQADQDIIIVSNTRGSSLDPSSDQSNLKTAKMGIDATRPLDKRPEGFELARIPGMQDIHLEEYAD